MQKVKISLQIQIKLLILNIRKNKQIKGLWVRIQFFLQYIINCQKNKLFYVLVYFCTLTYLTYFLNCHLLKNNYFHVFQILLKQTSPNITILHCCLNLQLKTLLYMQSCTMLRKMIPFFFLSSITFSKQRSFQLSTLFPLSELRALQDVFSISISFFKVSLKDDADKLSHSERRTCRCVGSDSWQSAPCETRNYSM